MFSTAWRSIAGLFATGFLMVSCLDTGLDSMDVTSEYDIVYLNDFSKKDDFSNDAYRIIAVIPKGDQWDVVVEYSGGCGEHIFYLWGGSKILYSDPPRADLYLIHNGNGDACEALIKDTVSFNLEQAFEGKYPDEGAYVTVHNETAVQSIEVDPNLARLSSDQCELKASVLESNCSINPWEGNWIIPTDSIPNHDQVVLLPIRIYQTASLQDIRPNKVTVGVTLLFGYDLFADQDAQLACDNWPTGTTVPVAIQCIKPD